MTSLARAVAAGLMLALAAAPATAAKLSAKPASRTDWTHVFAVSADGGMVMGNPKAKVKLVEYGSLTCPHCRRFDAEGVPKLIATYVRSGQVSWEFRNYDRDGFDLTAALIARCNGAHDFFALSRALYKDQPDWVAKAQKIPQEQLDAIADLPPDKQFATLAKVGGLQGWAAAHGLPQAKSAQCLSNVASVDRLVKMTGDATEKYPEFPGTPTFILNGAMLDKTASWDALEPQLKHALGG